MITEMIKAATCSTAAHNSTVDVLLQPEAVILPLEGESGQQSVYPSEAMIDGERADD